MKKMLVVYYSWSNGNTKRIDEMLDHMPMSQVFGGSKIQKK